MSNSLPLTIQTAVDIQEAVDYLQRLLATHRVKQTEPVGIEGVASETQTWARSFVTDDTVVGLEAGIKALLAVSTQLPVVEVITAAPLQPQTKQHVVEWLRREVDPQIIIRPAVRRSLIGGMVVRTSRRAYDLSVAQALQQSRAVLTELVHAWA